MATLKVTNIKNESFAGDQLYLKSNGYLGIGTTNPGEELEVSADAPSIQLLSTNASGRKYGFQSMNDGKFGIYDGTAGVNRIVLASDGKLGIGTTSPNSRLNLKLSSRGFSDFRITDSDTTNDVLRAGSQADGDGFLQLRTIAGAGNILLDASGLSYFNGGNVGIGTSSPGYLLHIRTPGTADAFAKIESESGDDAALLLDTSNGGGASADVRFQMDGTTKGSIQYVNNASSTDVNCMIFRNNANTERIKIKADGDVEIGGNLKTNNLSGRNLVINGAMKVSQRGTSFSGSATPEYTLDRFKQANGSSWNFDTTTTQESAGPDGFSKSLKITPDTTDTPTGGENGVIDYFIEGQDLQHLAFGTSSAKKVTVSFYAKSSAQNNNHQYTLQMWHKNSGASQFNINKAFTVTSAWQRFIITFPADTSNNMLDGSDQWVGRLTWILSSGPDDIASEVSTWTSGGLYKAVTGQSNFMDNTSNEFHLTGVQLEVGSIATEFEHKSYQEELLSCYRYYHQITNPRMNGYIPDNASKAYVFDMQHPVPMRSAPTVTITNTGSVGGQYVFDGSSNALVTTLVGAYSMSGSDIRYTEMDFNLSGDLTDTRGAWTASTNNTGRRSVYTFSSEF